MWLPRLGRGDQCCGDAGRRRRASISVPAATRLEAGSPGGEPAPRDRGPGFHSDRAAASPRVLTPRRRVVVVVVSEKGHSNAHEARVPSGFASSVFERDRWAPDARKLRQQRALAPGTGDSLLRDGHVNPARRRQPPRARTMGVAAAWTLWAAGTLWAAETPWDAGTPWAAGTPRAARPREAPGRAGRRPRQCESREVRPSPDTLVFKFNIS